MKKAVLIPLLIIFLFSLLALGEKYNPFSFLTSASPEISSPSDWIKENQIQVYPNKVILEINQPMWSSFTNTNSMDPFLDETANAIEIKPQSPEQIKVGDIISYQTEYGLIIHRVIEKGEDELGPYFIVKGDNNINKDPFKVRFEDIKGVLVAIIY